MVKQWQHGWRTGDTGRFAHSIRPVVSVKQWFGKQVEDVIFFDNDIKSYVWPWLDLSSFRTIWDSRGPNLCMYDEL
jgi:hypothetical protein